MLKMTELLDKRKYLHVWSCCGLKYLLSQPGAAGMLGGQGCPACVTAKGGWEVSLGQWLHDLQGWG